MAWMLFSLIVAEVQLDILLFNEATAKPDFATYIVKSVIH